MCDAVYAKRPRMQVSICRVVRILGRGAPIGGAAQCEAGAGRGEVGAGPVRCRREVGAGGKGAICQAKLGRAQADRRP